MPGVLFPIVPLAITAAPVVARAMSPLLRIGAYRGQMAIAIPNAGVRLLGRTITATTAGNLLIRGLQAAGIAGAVYAAADLAGEFIPGVPDLPGETVPGLQGGQIPEPGQIEAQGTVVKRWSANGVPFVRLSDGRIGAYSKARGRWKFWRPKRPIVMFSSGSSDLNTLLKADKAAEKQLRRLKKSIDRRFPSRRNTRATPGHSHGGGPTIIQESGPGGVQRT